MTIDLEMAIATLNCVKWGYRPADGLVAHCEAVIVKLQLEAPEKEAQASDEPKTDLRTREHGFKFPIDADRPLRLKAGGRLSREIAQTRLDVRLVVLSQRLDVYPGGEDRAYECRAVCHGGNTIKATTRFYEHELELAEPFPDEQEKENDDEHDEA